MRSCNCFHHFNQTSNNFFFSLQRISNLIFLKLFIHPNFALVLHCNANHFQTCFELAQLPHQLFSPHANHFKAVQAVFNIQHMSKLGKEKLRHFINYLSNTLVSILIVFTAKMEYFENGMLRVKSPLRELELLCELLCRNCCKFAIESGVYFMRDR